MLPSLRIHIPEHHPRVVASARLPAGVSYRVSYSQKRSWRADDWWISMQTYDARHAYVYLIEVFTERPLQFGVECLRRDLRWLYPLSGAFSVAGAAGREALKLTADEHLRVLSGPGNHVASVQSGRHLLFAFVLDWGWTRRYARHALAYLRRPFPVPITAGIRGHLLTLANLTPQDGLVMDADIYWPIARITHLTRQLYETPAIGSETLELALAARNYITDSLRLDGIPLTIGAIAAHFGVTSGHLSRMHKKHYGQPLQAYLMRQRLNTAYRLLSEEGRSVSAVAYQLGFSDVQAFNKLFRKYFGVAPSETRRR
ncbi:helix-turn-helix transcriptional regulator [Parapedobacter soli]|uniref:helix-turn-helix transcriptional regulator n=1 Tax=Parapedobacter soli TaxID=416955 RepID=UPI0021C72235|nr:helix-turn-helix transcriptional regulator [Parapedobacter soli]